MNEAVVVVEPSAKEINKRKLRRCKKQPGVLKTQFACWKGNPCKQKLQEAQVLESVMSKGQRKRNRNRK